MAGMKGFKLSGYMSQNKNGEWSNFAVIDTRLSIVA